MAIANVAQSSLAATGGADTIYTSVAADAAYVGLIDTTAMAATDEITITITVDVGTTTPTMRSTHLVGAQTEGFEIDPIYAADSITIKITQTVNTGTVFPYTIARLT